MTHQDEVLISELSLAASDGQQELSARVDGERVWFRFPANVPLQPRAELFLPLALQEAMVRGVPIRIAAPARISARIVHQLEAIQRIMVCWNDEDFRPVAVHAETSTEHTSNGIVASAYSGGIDSSYTYVCCRTDITHLLLVQGFDGESTAEAWQKNIDARQNFARSEGKTLIAVASNARTFIERRKLSWGVCHGSLLGAFGVALGADRFYIPSSFTYNELFAWGSHPLLDPLWSSEGTEIIHHGLEASRTSKTRLIAAQQNVLDHLQVCWRGVAGNCGNCPKCVRTSLALHLLGKTSRSLPAYHSAEQLRWLKPGNHAAMAFTDDLIQFCLQHQADAIAKQLRRFRKRFLLKYHSAELMKILFGNVARSISHRLWPKTWHDSRAKLQATRAWLL